MARIDGQKRSKLRLLIFCDNTEQKTNVRPFLCVILRLTTPVQLCSDVFLYRNRSRITHRGRGHSSKGARTIYCAKIPKTIHKIKEVKLFGLQGETCLKFSL